MQTRSYVKRLQHDAVAHTADAARPSHWRELRDAGTGQLRCRPAGSPAGHWPITPWWHCVFHDKYERINFWSHVLPGLFFLVASVLCVLAVLPGGAALAVFSACTATTHLISALTHVYPDSHFLEKCDHLGITATILGTPVTALMALDRGHVPAPLAYVCLALVAAAFLPALLRVLGFIGCGAAMVVMYGRLLANAVFVAELVLYMSGAAFFLRNGGHKRRVGFSDHHFLHYFVTVAACLHAYYLLDIVHRSPGGV